MFQHAQNQQKENFEHHPYIGFGFVWTTQLLNTLNLSLLLNKNLICTSVFYFLTGPKACIFTPQTSIPKNYTKQQNQDRCTFSYALGICTLNQSSSYSNRDIEIEILSYVLELHKEVQEHNPQGGHFIQQSHHHMPAYI